MTLVGEKIMRTTYRISIKAPCCNKKIKVAEYDYFFNACKTRKMLITILGNKKVVLDKIKHGERHS